MPLPWNRLATLPSCRSAAMLWTGLVCLLALCQAQEIKQLPGVGFELNFKHYSGFFQVSDTHLLHYWFVESQNDPIKDPLIFWFNGGPGCSSLDGLLNEMGPYVANLDGRSLRLNEYSWNKLASVVYIESPAGVGYSYATDGNITTNDDLTSLENYEAVKQFFKTFPQFQHHATYIMGESYGGVYVPTLTARIVDGQKDFPINLKVTGHCATMVEDIFQFLWAGGLNPYDLYRDCDPNPAVNGERMTHMLRGVAAGYKHVEQIKKKGDLMDFLRAKEPLYGDVPCLNDSDVITYMNDARVRKALNIPSNLPRWDICSNQVTSTYQKQYGDMAPFIKKIVAANVRVLLYYGDTDMACNFMMGQQFADQLGLKRILGKTPWKFDRQIAGFKTLFKGLTFMTVSFELNFKHYSGFLQVSDTHFLNYWFVESQNDPENDPLIFWFNGGPGCSSLSGLLQEMGPYIVTEDGRNLRPNDYSWNKFASVVYIESPAGVGYSYATDGNTTTNDDQTSLENYEAVKQFFKASDTDYDQKEPSYGGVYVPMLTARIVDGQKKFPINLKGMAIGNGFVNNEELEYNTLLRYAYFHGIVDEEMWNTIKYRCCDGCTDSCDITEAKHPPYGDIPCSNDSDVVTYMNDVQVRKALNIPSSFPRWDICSDQVMSTYQKQYGDMALSIKKVVAANVRVLLYYGDTDMACNFMMGQQFADELGLMRFLDKTPWRFNSQIAGFKTLFEGLTFLTVKGAGHQAPRWKAPQMYYAIQRFVSNQPI
ncbi:unnamed protein product [Heligmosomoides polygyrus]|uniref:Carboxypeptidase n=1 Tax=Heligmosomoides polygyrus TaxID=6339 RepID=A0A3P7X3M2_HELPZ|nr:unnamed protein product [Heligmosomoides polygyrus]